MQHTLKTESGEYLVVDVPDGSYLFSTEIDESEDWYTLVYSTDGIFGSNTEYTVKIPPGNWEIIGLYPGITEQQMAGIVDKVIYSSPFSDDVKYKDYLSDHDLPFDTASYSFASLLEANRIYEVNPLGEEPKITHDYIAQRYDHHQWQEAEERTSKFKLILKKL